MNYELKTVQALSDEELERIAKEVIETQEGFSSDEYALVVHYLVKDDVLNNPEKYLKEVVDKRINYLCNFSYDLEYEYRADFDMCQKAYTKWDELYIASSLYREVFFEILQQKFAKLRKLELRF